MMDIKRILLNFLYRVASETDSELLEDLVVYLAEHHCRMHLASLEFRKLVKSLLTVFVLYAEERKRYEHFVCVQTWVVAVEILNLCLLDRGDQLFRNELHVMWDSCKMLERVKE